MVWIINRVCVWRWWRICLVCEEGIKGVFIGDEGFENVVLNKMKEMVC